MHLADILIIFGLFFCELSLQAGYYVRQLFSACRKKLSDVISPIIDSFTLHALLSENYASYTQGGCITPTTAPPLFWSTSACKLTRNEWCRQALKQYQIKWCRILWYNYLGDLERGTKQENILSMAHTALIIAFLFVLDVRKKNGDEYPPNTLHSFAVVSCITCD